MKFFPTQLQTYQQCPRKFFYSRDKEIRALEVTAGFRHSMRHRMHAYRTGRVVGQGFAPQQLGVCSVAVFSARERRHGEHEFEAVALSRPCRYHRVDERAKPVMPAKEKVA